MTLRRSMVAWGALLAGALALAALSPTACSAGGDNADDDDGAGNSGAGGGLGIGGQNQGGNEACVAESFPGELAPLDLYIMLDKSGSMDDSGKWANVTSAIQTFVNASESDGMGVGLQFFPVPPNPPFTLPWTCSDATDCGPNAIYGPCMQAMCILQPQQLCCAGNMAPDTSCITADYSDAAVAIGELPGAASGLLSAISAESPEGDATPTLFAMEGAAAYATQWAADHPTHLTYIVFATDGEPTGCTGPQIANPVNTVDAAAAAAQAAANGSPAVPTFVIGVGSELGALNQIAVAGGTNQAYLVDVGNATQQFMAALMEIRAMGVCVFQIPTPEGGQQVDYDRVNVALVDPDNPADRVTLAYVGDISGCHPTEGGWYYDNVAAPTKILLCPSSCEHVRMTDWNIDVELGCVTVTR
ncbi:MAG: hypothetical protein JRI55_34905 [Deltaproteobacteria bacterium]|nr:hypothetical protein [Deltaproteobacteria bacterium]